MSNTAEKLRAIADAIPENAESLAVLLPEKKSPEHTDRHYRKKPVVIQAVQWTGDNLYEVIAFTDGPPDIRSMHANMKWDEYRDLVARDGLMIFTLEGKMLANVGDWIIKGVKGEHYPCKPDVFAATYEPASPMVMQPPDELIQALKAYELASAMPTHGDHSGFIWPKSTLRVPGKREWGYICEKHGLGYSGVCICCQDDFKSNKEELDWQARNKRDEALREASRLLNSALAAAGALQ